MLSSTFYEYMLQELLLSVCTAQYFSTFTTNKSRAFAKNMIFN